MTDVTGFGLLGHALEMARGAGLAARIDFQALPWLAQARELAGRGIVTGASGRNWASYGTAVQLGPGVDETARALLTDPQTSGGLLVACEPRAAAQVLAVFRDHGFEAAAVVGEMTAGDAAVSVE